MRKGITMHVRLVAGYAFFCIAAAVTVGAGLVQAADPVTPAPAAAPPATLEPVPEIPPPPNLDYAGARPQVTITQTPSETVEEASINGTLVWIKVTPRSGRSYYLFPSDGGSTFIRRDSLDTGLKVPMWVLFSW
jgi:hypothetical protein